MSCFGATLCLAGHVPMRGPLGRGHCLDSRGHSTSCSGWAGGCRVVVGSSVGMGLGLSCF